MINVASFVLRRDGCRADFILSLRKSPLHQSEKEGGNVVLSVAKGIATIWLPVTIYGFGNENDVNVFTDK